MIMKSMQAIKNHIGLGILMVDESHIKMVIKAGLVFTVLMFSIFIWLL